MTPPQRIRPPLTAHEAKVSARKERLKKYILEKKNNRGQTKPRPFIVGIPYYESCRPFLADLTKIKEAPKNKINFGASPVSGRPVTIPISPTFHKHKRASKNSCPETRSKMSLNLFLHCTSLKLLTIPRTPEVLKRFAGRRRQTPK